MASYQKPVPIELLALLGRLCGASTTPPGLVAIFAAEDGNFPISETTISRVVLCFKLASSTSSRSARAPSTRESYIPTSPWQHDTVCGICGKGFHVLRGRHHCRHCGISVCGKHSRNKAIVPSSLSSQRQRVCDTCFPACQSGVTRRRRKTVGARSISFKYETDIDGTLLTTTSTSQLTDYESTTTTSSTPASSVHDPPSRRQNRKIISLKRQQQQHQPQSLRQDVPSTYFATPEDSELEPVYEQQAMRPQRQRQQQRPMPSRRRASTSATMPKVLQRHADSMSSSGSSSFSSLHDYSDDDSECEELIAKYVRRGAPITTLSSSNGSTKHLGRSRVDSTPLEAIKEKHSLENPSQVDTVMKTLHQTPPLPASAVTGRTLQNRTMSGASAGTVSVTDSEEAEDSSDDASSFSDCDEEPVDEGHGEPSTPPARTLKAVAPIQPAAVKTAAAPAKREVLPVTPEKPRARKTPVLKPATVTAAAPYKITEQDRCVMREIAALELEIQKCQSELPELLEYLKKTERTAARLQEEAHESKLRVQQYKKAHCVVNRSIRNARALMKEQEYQAAILELLRASGIDRSSTTVWFLLAECRLKVGQLEDAEMACRKCFRLMQHACDRGGSGAACVALLGKILHEQGRHDEAIECYLTSLKR